MWDWLKWEFDRRIEVTPFIKFIIAERFIKGGLLIIGGLLLLFFSQDGRLVTLSQNIQEQLNFSPATNNTGLWRRLVNWAILKFGSLSQGKQDVIALAASLYGALEVFEGIGLLFRRRWAEYLLLVATLAFLPLEIDELFHHITVVKLAALLLNLAIVAYLIWKKRLFLERPGEPPVADVTIS